MPDVSNNACTKCLRVQSCWGFELRACSNCKIALYCSRECQKADWKHHKDHCSAEHADLRQEVKGINMLLSKSGTLDVLSKHAARVWCKELYETESPNLDKLRLLNVRFGFAPEDGEVGKGGKPTGVKKAYPFISAIDSVTAPLNLPPSDAPSDIERYEKACKLFAETRITQREWEAECPLILVQVWYDGHSRALHRMFIYADVKEDLWKELRYGEDQMISFAYEAIVRINIKVMSDTENVLRARRPWTKKDEKKWKRCDMPALGIRGPLPLVRIPTDPSPVAPKDML